MKQKGFAQIFLIIILLIIVGGGAYYIGRQTIRIPSVPIITSTPVIISTPTLKPTLSPTLSPTPIPTPKPFAEEERLIRKTLTGFEQYIGGRNTAGALTFFTPPISTQAKAKYESIRTQNLPFGLRGWSYVMDLSGRLDVEEIKNGYKVRVIESRTDGSDSILTFEMIRDEKMENGFAVDRYYTTRYMYQNNLGEEIKYQGFGL